MSGDAYVWAKAHPCPNARAKAVLVSLAGYADPDGWAWAPVSILLIETDLGSERTVQRALADLREAGIIQDTGEQKAHLGKLIPIYRLALDRGPATTRERLIQERRAAEAAAAPADGGASGVTPVSPQEPEPASDVTRSGDTGDALGVTPVSPKYIQGNLQSNLKVASAPAASAREGVADAVRKIEAAAPPEMLRVNKPDALAVAVADKVLGEGVPVAELVEALGRMAASDWYRTRRVPLKLHEWVADRQWRGWPAVEVAPDGPDPAAHAGGDEPPPVPPEIAAEVGGATARKWLVRAGWIDATRTIVAPSNLAADTLRRERKLVLDRLDVRVAAPRDLTQPKAST